LCGATRFDRERDLKIVVADAEADEVAPLTATTSRSAATMLLLPSVTL
jgi:hypothetical protein